MLNRLPEFLNSTEGRTKNASRALPGMVKLSLALIALGFAALIDIFVFAAFDM
jgi:hypothetical protein